MPSPRRRCRSPPISRLTVGPCSSPTAAAFLSLWAEQAERTGWRASDLFAVPGGLCWALEGREVVALSIAPSEATIRAKDAGAGPGATVTFHRSAKPLPLPGEQQT